jgi:hypothetical protein
MSAKFKTALGRQSVALSDLSITGCKMRAVHMSLAVGQKIVLRPEGMEGLTATVSWCSGQYAGVKFDHPLHPAIADHLCSLYPDETRVIGVDVAG